MGENASRIAWAGAGVPLPRRLVTARGVRLAVQRLLSDARYAERAQRFADWSRGHAAGTMAAETLEAFVA
jgi:UDP:flavonoid glycosyltransferase YjiC (YdhE family)